MCGVDGGWSVVLGELSVGAVGIYGYIECVAANGNCVAWGISDEGVCG